MIKIINGGVQSVVEDWPGRLGHMGNGMAPAGAMDNVALSFGNLLVGNDPGEAGIEIAVGFFQCLFEVDTEIAITGADMKPKLNDKPVPMWESFRVSKGDILKLAGFGDNGFRSYITVAGGIDVPLYLGSKSTCLFGNYGGYEGRALKANDVLKIGIPGDSLDKLAGRKLKKKFIPEYPREVILRSIVGMNGYPDFVSEEGYDFLFSHSFKVSLNANRSAIRLEEVPDWFFARETGGVGGSHPSNIVDHAYNMRGALNITGNTPSILIADGPTLGGFMCALNVINADLWKIGQLAPGRDYVKFQMVDEATALRLRKEQRELFSESSIVG
jgi:biotin-dependent carboxylase-like uncharacterized protein